MVETSPGEISLGGVGFQPDGLGAVAQGEALRSEVDVDLGSLQVGIGVAGLERDGGRVVGQGFLGAPGQCVADSPVESSVERIRVETDRFGEVRDGPVERAGPNAAMPRLQAAVAGGGGRT